MDELLTLEKRLDRIEEILSKKNEEKEPTNEVAPIIAKALPLIIKYLPTILNVLPELVKVLETDQLNDNSDKISTLKQFAEVGQKVADMFKDVKIG